MNNALPSLQTLLLPSRSQTISNVDSNLFCFDCPIELLPKLKVGSRILFVILDMPPTSHTGHLGRGNLIKFRQSVSNRRMPQKGQRPIEKQRWSAFDKHCTMQLTARLMNRYALKERSESTLQGSLKMLLVQLCFNGNRRIRDNKISKLNKPQHQLHTCIDLKFFMKDFHVKSNRSSSNS